jgi:hypothetical protein
MVFDENASRFASTMMTLLVVELETKTLLVSPVSGPLLLLGGVELEELPQPASTIAIPVAAQNVRTYFVRRIID